METCILTEIYIPAEIYALIFSFATVDIAFNCLTLNETAYYEAIKKKPSPGTKYIYTKNLPPTLFATNIEATKIVAKGNMHLFATWTKTSESPLCRKNESKKYMWFPGKPLSGTTEKQELMIIPMKNIRIIVFDHRCYDTELRKMGTQLFSSGAKEGLEETNTFMISEKQINVPRNKIYIIEPGSWHYKVYLYHDQLFSIIGLWFTIYLNKK